MSNIKVDYDILNQKQTPAFYASSLATQPAFGFPGRIFIDTDTPSSGIYRDTGSAWVQVADPGAGTTGTLQQVTTNGNTTTLPILVETLNIGKGNSSVATNTAFGITTLTNNTTGSNNTAIGNVSLNANTTGLSNTAIGSFSLPANTTGNYNTALGMQSLYNNSTGANNTALGQGALALNTTASNNTAVGGSSLAANTTGANNVGLGYQSLSANTTGANNSAVGYVSLSANTTGGGNAAFGFQSLTNNTTGTNNTSVGSGALSNNTTGISNTAIGQSSLGANLTGSYNVALGVGTLGNNLGSYNVGIGHSSLNAVTTGTNNSAIGYASGSAITTGSNNTIIGGYGGTTTLASNIVLSDGAGNVRLFSDANGLIGINQAVSSVPGGQLDIHTTQTYALVLNGLSTSNAYTAFSNASVGKWRIGNTYNAGANSFDIFNLGTSSNALSFNSTTNAAIFNSSITPGGIIYGINGTLDPTIGTNAGTTLTYNNFSSNNNYSTGLAAIRNGAYDIFFQTGAANGGGYRFYIGTSEKMTMSNTGNVLIGSTTDDTINKLQVTGSAKFTDSIIGNNNLQIIRTASTSVGTGSYIALINTSNSYQIIQQLNASYNLDFWSFQGSFTNISRIDGVTGIYTPLSDINKKKDFELSNLGLNEILNLKPTLYRMKEENNTNKHLGFIAQEVKDYIPQAFIDNEGFIGLNYQAITATLVKAIQELNEKLVRNNIY